MSIARGGQILITDSVKDNLATWIKSQKKKAINIKSYGRLKLKGIKEEVLIKAGLANPLGVLFGSFFLFLDLKAFF